MHCSRHGRRRAALICLIFSTLMFAPMLRRASAAEPSGPSNPAQTGMVRLSDDELFASFFDGESATVPEPLDPHAGPRYTLSELEEIALASNPTLQQAAAEVMRLSGICEQVGLKPNPIVGYQAAEIGADGRAGQQGFFIGQEFVRGNKLELNRAVASNAVQQAKWKREIQQHRVINTVRQRYYEALSAEQTLELALELQDLAKTGAEMATRLEQAGEGTYTQVLQAQIEAQSNLNVVKTARVRHEAAVKRLAAAIGVPTLRPEHLAGSLDQTPPTFDYDSLWAWVTENSPELQAAYYAVHRARWSIQRAEAEPIPNVDGQLGMAHDFAGDDFIVNVQIGIAVPYYNRNQGNITAAQAEHIRASREIERLRLDLQDRLAMAFQHYQSAKIQADSFRDEILPRAKKNLDLVRKGYEGGELDYLQLLTAQRTFFQQSLAAVSARASLWMSVVRLQGLLIPEGLAAPGETASEVEPPDANTTFPLGLFPMMLP